LRRQLEQQVRDHGLQDAVQLVGVLNQRDIREILSRTQVFVLPCVRTENGDQDGIPVSLMEAMALRVPVITTRVSGMPELVTDGVSGLLVSPHDPGSLAAALERLLKDSPLRVALGNGGRKAVEQRYDVNQSAAQLEGIFLESIASSRPASLVNHTLTRECGGCPEARRSAGK
jgi:glycosyltransferase involved in cell wall biosynthesis